MEPFKNAFKDFLPKIEKILAGRIETKRLESDGTVFLRGK